MDKKKTSWSERIAIWIFIACVFLAWRWGFTALLFGTYGVEQIPEVQFLRELVGLGGGQ